MFDLRLLNHFDAVFRHRNFSKAAEEIGLSQSALTKSIKVLEASWGVELFSRTTRTVTPTEAGHRLKAAGEDLLAHAETVKTQTVGGERILRVVTGANVLETFAHKSIARFRELYPNTRVVIQTLPPRNAMEELMRGRVHVLMYHSLTVASLPHPQRLKTREIYSAPLYMLSRKNHPVLSSDMTLEAAFAFDWAVVNLDNLFIRKLSEPLQGLIEKYEFPKYRLLSVNACIELVRSCDALAFVPASAVEYVSDRDEFVLSEMPLELNFSVSAAALNEGWDEPMVSDFIKTCSEL